jgi:uncharacterized protein
VAEIFAGATLTIADDRKDYGELRFITIGRLDGRMVVIISLRKANDREQALYGDRLD